MQHLTKLIEALQKASPLGSTTTDSLMTTQKWPSRLEVLPEEMAVSMHSLLRQDKFKKTWKTLNCELSQKPITRFTFNACSISPEEETVLREALMRPSFNSLMPHLLALATAKKVDQSDMSAQAYVQIVFEALSGYSECALILAMRYLRDDDASPFFPQISAIKAEADMYNRHYDTLAEEFILR